jgi:nucleotide-binding universal stress UspA family protein
LRDVMHIRKLIPQWTSVRGDLQNDVASKAAEAMHQQLDAIHIGEHRPRTMIVDAGSPHAGLLSQADVVEAGIIVLGPGKVADRVVRHARVPVLVARASLHGPIIGATDFSDPSLPALETAAAEARRRGAPLHLLHVVDVGAHELTGVVEMGFPGTPSTGLDLLSNLLAAARRDLQASFDRFDVGGQVHAVAGRAADAIIAHAKAYRAQLVVVGTHGRTGLARLTLGSTAEQVLEDASCSVLVVRLSTGTGPS